MKDQSKTAAKLSFGTKLGYGGAEGGCSGSWNLIYMFLLYFLTDVVGINPALAGSVLMIATLWDAFTDPGAHFKKGGKLFMLSVPLLFTIFK